MKVDPKDFRVTPDRELKLSDRSTKVKPFFKSKTHYLIVTLKELEMSYPTVDQAGLKELQDIRKDPGS